MKPKIKHPFNLGKEQMLKSNKHTSFMKLKTTPKLLINVNNKKKSVF